MKPRSATLLLLLLGFLIPAAAEPGEFLVVNINPQVRGVDHSIAWEQPLTKVTKPGVPVVVNIGAQGLAIRVTVTAFVRDQEFFLVVQGDVKQTKENGTRGSTTVQSLMVPQGESIAYFPLGRVVEGSGPQMVVLIQVEFQDE